MATQLYQNHWFHAIFMPVIIEFFRCIGTYLSAKFELSTLVNDNMDFENTLKIAEKYPNVGLEIFPLWHKTGYDLVLEKYKKRLTQIPISVHEQYYE
ncbi:MAG: hypothetical protein UHD64_11165, partial [Bacteroidales bacterium]|nr:hypothetical protein [Bacteroidales bacterium]